MLLLLLKICWLTKGEFFAFKFPWEKNFEALKIILKVSVLATSWQLGYSGLDEWFWSFFRSKIFKLKLILLRQIYNTYGKCILRHSNAISYLELLPEHLEGRWQGKKERLYLLVFRLGKNFRGVWTKVIRVQEKR